MLRIHDKKFASRISDEIFKKEIIPALNQLPEPDLVSHEATHIDSQKAIICSQREVVYVDLLNPVNNIKQIQYIGTKNSHDCILLYMHTETDHLVAHVDNSNRRLNLSPRVSAFTDKKNIEVYLVGGLTDHYRAEFNQASINNLKKIIDELCEVAIRLKLTITITKQKTLHRNNFNMKSYQFLFDFFVVKADIICRQYFNSSINENDLKHFSIVGFKSREITNDEPVMLLNRIIYADEIYDKNDERYSEKITALSQIKSRYSNKSEFLKAVEQLFNKDEL